jgi:hypothetical protein
MQRLTIPLLSLSFVALAMADNSDVTLSVLPGDTFGITNVGNSPIHNPRLVRAGGLDYIDYNRLLGGLYDSLPKKERNRESLMLAAWRHLGSAITDYCSPGREGLVVGDPLDLISGYGYGCCSHTNRAFGNLAAHLGYPIHFISTPWHQVSEVLFNHRWQVIDSNRGVRWFARRASAGLETLGVSAHGLNPQEPVTFDTAANCQVASPKQSHCDTEYWSESIKGIYRQVSGEELNKVVRDHVDSQKIANNLAPEGINPNNHFRLYPGDELFFDTSTSVVPLTHATDWKPPFPGLAYWTTTINPKHPWTTIGPRGQIEIINIGVPFPILDVTFRMSDAAEGSRFKVFVDEPIPIKKALMASTALDLETYEGRSIAAWASNNKMAKAKAGYEKSGGLWTKNIHRYLAWRYLGTIYAGTPFSNQFIGLPDSSEHSKNLPIDKIQSSFLIGRATAGGWTITREDTEGLMINKRLMLRISGNMPELRAVIRMQYNPRIFGVQTFDHLGRNVVSKPQVLQYLDDSGNCSRRISLKHGSENEIKQLGERDCSSIKPRTTGQKSFEGARLAASVESARGCSVLKNGVAALVGNSCQAVFRLPIEPQAQYVGVKVKAVENLQWFVKDGRLFKYWHRLKSFRYGKYEWLELPQRNFGASVVLRMIQTAPATESIVLVEKIFSETGLTRLTPKFLE